MLTGAPAAPPDVSAAATRVTTIQVFGGEIPSPSLLCDRYPSTFCKATGNVHAFVFFC
jgi:hypothetical protein